ncbi:MAG: class I SAM-dependent methyltransferase [Dehalococcoidia bacterium]|jgi:SAM-dependent methyltransferase|nr:class I SAM-dependent methyltransferase [Dehalococcoidia bacterium]
MHQASDEFYHNNSRRYAEVSNESLQIHYDKVSHPLLTGDKDLIARMKELIPQDSKGLDAGCGAGARDVFLYWSSGYDISGIDAVPENILVAQETHPEIADRVSVADLSAPLDLPSDHFNFVLCNAVIQHIFPELIKDVTLPELARVLKVGGVLQLMFKVGDGMATVFDGAYGSYRTFQLYGADAIVSILSGLGLEVLPPDEEKLSGVMYFTDPKPMDHCVLFARKIR